MSRGHSTTYSVSIYAGNSQGGPEIRDMMDSVIAGVYWDYAVKDLFSEDGYKFGLFRSDLSSSYNTDYDYQCEYSLYVSVIVMCVF